jgi:hypothetical protein
MTETLFLAYFPYFEKIKEAYEVTLLSVCLSPPQLLCMCVLFRGNLCTKPFPIATPFSSGSTIPAFRRHGILPSKLVGRDAFYEVRVVSNTQYIVKGK